MSGLSFRRGFERFVGKSTLNVSWFHHVAFLPLESHVFVIHPGDTRSD
jgi:hypothetical protein